MNAVKTDPNRNKPAMTMDGQFLCAKCVKDNAGLIDAAALDSLVKPLLRCDDWAIAGYCGDKSDTIVHVGGKKLPLVVNKPTRKDACAHCGVKPIRMRPAR